MPLAVNGSDRTQFSVANHYQIVFLYVEGVIVCFNNSFPVKSVIKPDERIFVCLVFCGELHFVSIPLFRGRDVAGNVVQVYVALHCIRAVNISTHTVKLLFFMITQTPKTVNETSEGKYKKTEKYKKISFQFP